MPNCTVLREAPLAVRTQLGSVGSVDVFNKVFNKASGVQVDKGGEGNDELCGGQGQGMGDVLCALGVAVWSVWCGSVRQLGGIDSVYIWWNSEVHE
ncbi:hypothetical protein E2C01_077602 [Portunus trituberculatus]|uniref:Uncharacterized protein n=1 Tax=Portunus trituberculatus TaxID=210409 RepID=A0A5B7IKM4_PORTR|nr:hypothetical protein [Portunus trituberculatus]